MDQRKQDVYRGVPMIEGWPEKIIEAQGIPSALLQGKSVARVRYGNEQSNWARTGEPRLPRAEG